jgi:hypothetical protein
MLTDAQQFTDGDDAYLRWLDQHPQGFIINTTRNKSPNYMVLHRADCKTIRTYTRMAQPGGFTERQYIKICATDVASLRDWVRHNGRADGSFTSECPLCKPI